MPTPQDSTNTAKHSPLHAWMQTNANGLVLFVTVITAFFLNLGGFPLFDMDEGAYAETTREMFERGDFISTYMNGVAFYDKPALTYWLQAMSAAIFGYTELAFRLPSALAATAWTLLIFAFVRREYDEHTAVTAAAVASLATLTSMMGKAAIPDALLILFISGAMFSIYRYYQVQNKRYVYFAFISMAFGFMAKGPIAVAIPAIVSLMFFAMKGQWWLWLRAVFNPVGIALFLLIASPWYIAQYLKEGQAFLEGFFLKHNVGRFQNPMEGHSGSIFYYLPVALIGSVPFTAAILLAVKRSKQLIHDDFLLFNALWFLFVLVFFSLAGTKLPHYINYGFTGLLLIAALHLQQLRSRFWALLPATLFLTTLLFLPDILAAIAPTVKEPFFHESMKNVSEHFSAVYRGFFVLAIACTVFFIFEKRLQLRSKLIASGFLTVIAMSLFVLPAIGDIVQEPAKQAAAFVKQHDYQVVMWRVTLPSFSVYSDRVVPKREPEIGEIALTTPAHLARLKDYEVLYQQGGVVLARVLAFK